jgi:sulfur carrier protein ThiS
MKLHLGGHLSFYLPGHPRQLDVQLDGPTLLSEVLARVGIPVAEIFIVAVNGEMVDPYMTLVSQVDEVKLYPPVDGG